MVLMKNSANDFAPRAVCCVASSGMIGGFSPGLVLGPVVGTSAGRVGLVGPGGPGEIEDTGPDVVGGGTDTVGRPVTVGVGTGDEPGDEPGDPPVDEVHAAQPNMTNAANVQILPTTE